MSGWDELKGSPTEKVEEEQDIDFVFLRLFNTKDGKKILKFLEYKTVKQPTWYPGEEASHGFVREGQNSIIRDITKRIERARNHE